MQQKIVFGYEKVVVECFWLVWIFLVIMVLRSKKITFREMVIFNSWVFLIMLAQYTSKRQVSEYYFSNLFPLFVVLMAIFFGGFKTRWLAIIAAVYLSLNLWWLIKKSDVDHSYLYRRQLVEYIAKKVKDKGYPCISINYIADFGVGVGFRYLFWYNGVQVVKSDPAVMGYDIVIPYNVSESEISRKFGRFGVIEHKDLDAIDVDICKEKRLELEPLLGYTE